MASLARRPWCLASGLLVPLLSLASPGWLSLAGVGPAWAVLWLLPWALVEGAASGLLAGLALGLLLDAGHSGLHGAGPSLVPGLVLLGWWWGRLGRRGPPIERSFSLGLLALLGSLLLGLSLLAQLALAAPGGSWDDLAAAGLHALLAQTLLTALLAPMLCSLQLLLWRQLTSAWRG